MENQDLQTALRRVSAETTRDLIPDVLQAQALLNEIPRQLRQERGVVELAHYNYRLQSALGDVLGPKDHFGAFRGAVKGRPGLGGKPYKEDFFALPQAQQTTIAALAHTYTTLTAYRALVGDQFPQEEFKDIPLTSADLLTMVREDIEAKISPGDLRQHRARQTIPQAAPGEASWRNANLDPEIIPASGLPRRNYGDTIKPPRRQKKVDANRIYIP